MGVNIKKVLEEKNKKLTGRELFLSDKSLNESDLKFLEVEGKTDESWVRRQSVGLLCFLKELVNENVDCKDTHSFFPCFFFPRPLPS